MKTVCVDLDGVLAQYDGWKGVEHIGDPIPGARKFLISIRDIPAEVCIWTTRLNTEVNRGTTRAELLSIIQKWLRKHALPYDSIALGAKPSAAAYVDDKAVSCRPQDGGSYADALHSIDKLIAGL